MLLCCSACNRHYKPESEVCPFCGVYVESSVALAPAKAATMTVVVGLALASCTQKKGTEETTPPASEVEMVEEQQTPEVEGACAGEGPPPTVEDAEPEDESVGTDDGSAVEAPIDFVEEQVPPYSCPPRPASILV